MPKTQEPPKERSEADRDKYKIRAQKAAQTRRANQAAAALAADDTSRQPRLAKVKANVNAIWNSTKPTRKRTSSTTGADQDAAKRTRLSMLDPEKETAVLSPPPMKRPLISRRYAPPRISDEDSDGDVGHEDEQPNDQLQDAVMSESFNDRAEPERDTEDAPAYQIQVDDDDAEGSVEVTSGDDNDREKDLHDAEDYEPDDLVLKYIAKNSSKREEKAAFERPFWASSSEQVEENTQDKIRTSMSTRAPLIGKLYRGQRPSSPEDDVQLPPFPRRERNRSTSSVSETRSVQSRSDRHSCYSQRSSTHDGPPTSDDEVFLQQGCDDESFLQQGCDDESFFQQEGDDESFFQQDRDAGDVTQPSPGSDLGFAYSDLEDDKPTSLNLGGEKRGRSVTELFDSDIGVVRGSSTKATTRILKSRRTLPRAPRVSDYESDEAPDNTLSDGEATQNLPKPGRGRPAEVVSRTSKKAGGRVQGKFGRSFTGEDNTSKFGGGKLPVRRARSPERMRQSKPKVKREESPAAVTFNNDRTQHRDRRGSMPDTAQSSKPINRDIVQQRPGQRDRCEEGPSTDLVYPAMGGKLSLTKQNDRVQAIIRRAMENLFISLYFDNSFPTLGEKVKYGKDALVQAARELKYGGIKARLMVDQQYADHMATIPDARISITRGELKKIAAVAVVASYRLSTTRRAQHVEILINSRKYLYLYPEDPHTRKPLMKKPFLNPLIITVLNKNFFKGSRSFVKNHYENFIPEGETQPQIPGQMLALAATAVFAALYEWQTGEFKQADFSTDKYASIYHDHIEFLVAMKSGQKSAGDYAQFMGKIFSEAMGTESVNTRERGGRSITAIDVDAIELDLS